MDEPVTRTTRRDMLKRAAIGAGVAWAAPVLTTMDKAWAQAAGSPPPATSCCRCKNAGNCTSGLSCAQCRTFCSTRGGIFNYKVPAPNQDTCGCVGRGNAVRCPQDAPQSTCVTVAC